MPQFTPPIVVTNQDHRFVVAEQLRDAGIRGGQILLEPVGRNSAPGDRRRRPAGRGDRPRRRAVDHGRRRRRSAIWRRWTTAVRCRRCRPRGPGYFVTFGMQPTAPGNRLWLYRPRRRRLEGLPGVFRLDRFIEKPDAAKAAKLLESGGQSLEFRHVHVPRRHAAGRNGAVLPGSAGRGSGARWQTRTPDLDFIRLGAEAFEAAPDISIDYAIAEKTDKAVVVPAAIGWSDVGSWSALAEIAPKDANGNVALGDVVLEDSNNSYARSDGILTALLGVRDLVVVTTQDAVLVAHKDEAQNVKKIVDRLKQMKRPEADTHNRTYRPWGFYESLIQGDRFQVKRIVVLARAETIAAKAFPPRRTLGRGGRLRRRDLRCRDPHGA